MFESRPVNFAVITYTAKFEPLRPVDARASFVMTSNRIIKTNERAFIMTSQSKTY